jgi:hypothetical protein
MAIKMKKRVGVHKDLVSISKSKWKKATRNHRCTVIGGDEGGSTWQCGKQVLVSDHVNDRYYKMVGKNASYVSYAAKQRRSHR